MSKQYTRTEVEKSNGKEKTLIILHDKVYDVTSFLNEHPGGEEILLDHGGKDGSEDFDDVGHSKDAFDLMKKFLVGELVESDRSNKSPKSGWTSSYAKQPKQAEPEGGMNALVLAGIMTLAAAILYWMYF